VQKEFFLIQIKGLQEKLTRQKKRTEELEIDNANLVESIETQKETNVHPA
jgi:hypothetical protein